MLMDRISFLYFLIITVVIAYLGSHHVADAAVVADWSTCILGVDTCSNTGSACCMAPADVAAGKTTCRASPTSNCANTASWTTRNFAGASSFYLFNLDSAKRASLLSSMQSAGYKVLRIFITGVGPNSKGSGNPGVNDLEQFTVGTYNDTILTQIDNLMYQAYQVGIKLTIVLHDRYALGCWGSDAYVSKYSLPTSANCNPPNNPASFYTNQNAINDFYARARHILNHKNPYFNNRAWSTISEAIFAFEPENESQAHMTVANPLWMCGVASVIKPLLAPGILVATGGGAAFSDSMALAYFQCAYIDVVTLHDYSQATAAGVAQGISLGKQYGKRVFLEEFGASPGTVASKASQNVAQSAAASQLGVPWNIWEFMTPDGGASQYEINPSDSVTWGALQTVSLQTLNYQPGVFAWPEVFNYATGPTNSVSGC